MRILIASAHFPPNFVSGGTLVPHRLALGLLARGHDVEVHAGWLGDRPPLESWTETEPGGLPVTWVVTTPWTAWSDERNYDHDAVAEGFERHLARFQPDVVHFHSIQTLGAGLVEAAHRAGARTVVTMHDFFWVCARQFLVDRQYEPCGLVVSCSDCPCEVDRPWLDRRNARLARALAGVDRVLAVSPLSMDVLAANGVRPDALALDENAIPAGPAATAAGVHGGCAPHEPVRFLYTGGSDRMKGVHVLLAAARRLAGTPGWTLTLVGAEQHVRDTATPLDGLPVTVTPAFAPDELDAVFATHDVLLVPSVMRETFSLVTREGLQRGLPVICTDSLGPEEVVADGVNGLVVRSGDEEELAAAMAAVVHDRPRLARLTAGAGRVDGRSIDEQLDGLEHLYAELLLPRAAPAPPPARSVRHVVFAVGIEGAPLRYRARLAAESLALVGVTSDVLHYRDPELPERAAGADAVVFYRVPATRQTDELLAGLRSRGIPLFFDVDDLIFDPDLAAEIPALTILPPEEADLWLEGVRRYRSTMERCDAFIGSTDMLCRHAEAVVGLPSHRWANGVGIELARASDAARRRPRSPGPLRIGYLSGTNTHDNDWAMIEPAVVEVLGAHPSVELWLGGLVTPSSALDPFSARVRRLPFLPWRDLPGVLRDLDVNLAPLEPESRFNEAKSAIKWLEAALTETATVASPTEPFREAIVDGLTGVFAADRQGWVTAMTSLLDDPLLRAAIGRRAHRSALLRWSPHLQGRRYLEILQGGALADASRVSTWAFVANDEPPMPVALEPYEPPPTEPPVTGSEAPPPAPPSVPARAAAVVRRGAAAVRDEGAVSAAARTLRYGRRQAPRVAQAVRRRLSHLAESWRRR